MYLRYSRCDGRNDSSTDIAFIYLSLMVESNLAEVAESFGGPPVLVLLEAEEPCDHHAASNLLRVSEEGTLVA